MKIFIPHTFTSLNKYIAADRKSRFAGGAVKKEETEQAFYSFIGKKIKTPCKVHFHWKLKDRRSDLDNIGFAAKFILDGAVKAKAIPDDGLKYIQEIKHTFEIDKNCTGVEITFEEML